MLTINRETDYACRVILHLALLPEETRVTAQQIARKRIIPRALIRRVITKLSHAELLTSVRGHGGGIRLARPSSEINMRQVVEAIEGEIALNACVINPKTCPLMKTCTVHLAWASAQQHLVAELEQATFDKLVESKT